MEPWVVQVFVRNMHIFTCNLRAPALRAIADDEFVKVNTVHGPRLAGRWPLAPPGYIYTDPARCSGHITGLKDTTVDGQVRHLPLTSNLSGGSSVLHVDSERFIGNVYTEPLTKIARQYPITLESDTRGNGVFDNALALTANPAHAKAASTIPRMWNSICLLRRIVHDLRHDSKRFGF